MFPPRSLWQLHRSDSTEGLYNVSGVNVASLISTHPIVNYTPDKRYLNQDCHSMGLQENWSFVLGSSPQSKLQGVALLHLSSLIVLLSRAAHNFSYVNSAALHGKRKSSATPGGCTRTKFPRRPRLENTLLPVVLWSVGRRTFWCRLIWSSVSASCSSWKRAPSHGKTSAI